MIVQRFTSYVVDSSCASVFDGVRRLTHVVDASCASVFDGVRILYYSSIM